MKKTLTLVLLFFTPSLLFLILSCDPSLDCNCPPNKGVNFETTGLHFNFYNYLNSPTTPLNDSVVVNQNNLNMLLEFDVQYYNLAHSTINLLSLTNAAYACSCIANGEAGSIERVDYIKVTTVHDLDSLHPAGSQINDLLNLSIFGNPIEFEDLPNNNLLYEQFELSFKDSIAPTTLQLAVELKMVDGNVYNAQSAAVKVN